MARNLFISCAFLASLLIPIATAGPITVNYVEAVINGPTVVSLPYTLGATANVRLKFFVPDYASLTSLNSLQVSVNLFDDGDIDPDRGSIVFTGATASIPLNSFTDLNTCTVVKPCAFNSSLTGADLSAALTEIQGDGYFFIRVNRDNRPAFYDFTVQGATVTMDGEAPEPSTIGLLGAGLGAGFLVLRRRARA